MKARVKKLALRHLPQNLLLAAQTVHQRIDHRRRSSIREGMGLLPLAQYDFRSLRQSDTVFIFGSGASIRAISPERWEWIAEHDSIGFNFWLRHEFVPTIFALEVGSPTAVEHFIRLGKGRDDYASVPKIFSTANRVPPAREEELQPLFNHWSGMVYHADTVATFGRNHQELVHGMERLKSRGLFSQTRLSRLFKHMGSVTTMIHLAVHMGYQHIVLCGVDLNNGGYFFHHSDYPDMEQFRRATQHRAHPTIRDPVHPGVDQVLSAFDEVVLQPAGVRLWLENHQSALHPAFPVASPSRLSGGHPDE